MRSYSSGLYNSPESRFTPSPCTAHDLFFHSSTRTIRTCAPPPLNTESIRLFPRPLSVPAVVWSLLFDEIEIVTVATSTVPYALPLYLLRQSFVASSQTGLLRILLHTLFPCVLNVISGRLVVARDSQSYVMISLIITNYICIILLQFLQK